MTNPELEEKLREAACFGDIDGVKELINKGVNVNSQHDINGWTALHWAAKRNHLNIVNLLCNHGADKNIKTNKGELPAALTSEGVIKVLLSANLNASNNSNSNSGSPQPTKKEEKLAITPNYIRNPPMAYKVDTNSREKEQPPVQEKRPRLDSVKTPPPPPPPTRQILQIPAQEKILKVRAADSDDPDYIEIEVPGQCLTLDNLILVAATELGMKAGLVERVRKMPNTRLRRDKEVERLEDYQEIELVSRR